MSRSAATHVASGLEVGSENVGSESGAATLKSRYLELTILPERGCNWSRLRASVKGEWTDLLASAPGAGPSGCSILAPWSDQIAGATFEFDGQTHSVRPNGADGTATDGDVHSRPWRVTSFGETQFEATLDSRECDDFNFPFALKFTHRIELQDECLRVELFVENCDARQAPVGFGFHPRFRRRLSNRDKDALLRVPAKKVYPLASRLPVGQAVDVDGSRNLRELEVLGERSLGDCYTELEDDTVRLIYPGTGLEVRFQVDPVFGHMVVCAPSDPNNNPAAEAVTIEPASNVSNGFNLFARGWPDTGVKILEPGETWGGGWALSVGDV